MKRNDEPIYITKSELYPLKIYPFGDIIILGPNNPIPYLDASFTTDWPYYGRIWNHFFNIYEERALTENDLLPAQPFGPLLNRVLIEDASIRVYASMVADLFHYGHVQFLKQAHSLGTHVIVGIIPDDIAAMYKRKPILTQEERIKVIDGCKHINEIIPDAPLTITKDFIEKHTIDFVIHGDDFDEQKLQAYFADPVALNMMILTSYTPGISTSDIIERIKKASS